MTIVEFALFTALGAVAFVGKVVLITAAGHYLIRQWNKTHSLKS
jgi:Flp pilus assembly pilin Flp